MRGCMGTAWRSRRYGAPVAEAQERTQRGWRPGPVFAQKVGTTGPHDGAEDDSHEERVVELADDRNEVGNLIERHGEVGDQGDEQELAAAGDALVGEQPAEEHHEVGDKARERPGPGSTPGNEKPRD